MRDGLVIFSHLTMGELKALYEAYTMAADVFVGFQNRPLCQPKGAMRVLDEECERVDRIACQIVQEAAGRRPTSRDDRHIRARIMAVAAVESEDWIDAVTSILSVVVPTAKANGDSA